MKVLFDHQIFSSQPQGGVSRYFFELLKGCEGQGVETLAAWKYSSNRYLHGWDPERFGDWCPSVRFKGKAHLTYLFNGLFSRRVLQTNSWNVFHPTYFDPYFLPLLRGRPFVLTIHDMTHELHPKGLSDRRYLSERKRVLAQKACRVICVSENTRQDAIRILGLDPDKVVRIPHGNSLRPGTIAPSLPREEGYWLYVGSRSDYKNWYLLVEALAVRADRAERLVMVGGGPLSEVERQALLEAGMEGRFVQTSATDGELAGWYQRARALVYPSLYEGFGMPLIEAMAWDCPVIAARSSCFPEIGGEAALYFDPTSVNDLVQALEKVCQPTIRESLIRAGRARQSTYSWERTVDATLAVYRACQ